MSSHMLLQNREYIEELEKALITCKTDVLIVSAFLRSEILEWASEKIPKNCLVNIVTRWTPQDLLVGASDIKAFEVSRKNKWGFYIDQDLHAKSVLVDSVELFLGSANFTSRGTHLFGVGNNELCMKIKASVGESNRIKEYVTNSYKVTMPMFVEIKAFLEGLERDVNQEKIKWPRDIKECIKPVVNSIWIDECFYSSPEEFYSGRLIDQSEHDKGLFGVQKPTAEVLKKTRMVKWLDQIIHQSDKKNLTFGYLSKRLHDAIIPDPKPYRKDVKVFLKNLFEWVQEFNLYEIERHRTTISIINKR